MSLCVEKYGHGNGTHLRFQFKNEKSWEELICLLSQHNYFEVTEPNLM
jgi:hypothetical protein